MLSRADVPALPLSYPAQQSQGGCTYTERQFADLNSLMNVRADLPLPTTLSSVCPRGALEGVVEDSA